MSIQLLSLMGYTPTRRPMARYLSMMSVKPCFLPSSRSRMTSGSTTYTPVLVRKFISGFSRMA